MDISDWTLGETGTHWSPKIPLDRNQYLRDREKLDTIYSLVGSGISKVEDATYVKGEDILLNIRRLMEYSWDKWGFQTGTTLDYATEVATRINYNLVSATWNPWGYLPPELNLVIVRRVHESDIFWLNNFFYIGEDPEASDVINI